jgi:hypothetical protein
MPEPMKDPEPPVVERPAEVRPPREAVATYTFERASPTVLLQKQEKTWRRLGRGERVSSEAALVALPGYACSVKTDGGVNLLLRGFVPQFATPAIEVTTRLLDCSITLHPNNKVDADLTLHRGRLYISNEEQPATVIVRFGKETWVIRLSASESEVGLDLVTRYTPGINYLDGEEPLAELYFVLLKGKAELRVDTLEFPNLTAPPGRSFYAWTSQTAHMREPGTMDEVPAAWSKAPPAGKVPREMTMALKELATGWTEPRGAGVVLKEGLSNPRLAVRLVSIYALGAVDQVSDLLDQLGDEDPAHTLERDEAASTLRRWISRDAQHSLAFYNPRTESGILIDKRYLPSEALTLVTLFHIPRAQRPGAIDNLGSKLGYLLGCMRSPRLAIRHVAQLQLNQLTATVPNKPIFNAAGSPDVREAGVSKFAEMLQSGALTPRSGVPN